MYKIVELMKTHTGFSADSRFIDIGCGLGKPNLYVAQDPGVSFSYGIECQKDRYRLGLDNLYHVIKAAKVDQTIGTNCILELGDILNACTLDPFTHVYQFDIGFPKKLFRSLAKKFNCSQCLYLISFQPCRFIINAFKYHVKLITKKSTIMHGSNEHHTVYIYKRNKPAIVNNGIEEVPCDPLFKDAWDVTVTQRCFKGFEKKKLPQLPDDLINVILSHAPNPIETHVNQKRGPEWLDMKEPARKRGQPVRYTPPRT